MQPPLGERSQVGAAGAQELGSRFVGFMELTVIVRKTGSRFLHVTVCLHTHTHLFKIPNAILLM